MAEENQVTTKIQRKWKRVRDWLSTIIRREKMQKSEEQKSQKSEVLISSMCYSILAVGVTVGSLGYYVYQAKVNNIVPNQQPSPQQPRPQTNNFEME